MVDFAESVRSKRLIYMGPPTAAQLDRIKTSVGQGFHDGGLESVLVLCAVPRNQGWLKVSIEGMMEPFGSKAKVKFLEDALDFDTVKQCLDDYGVTGNPSDVVENELREYLAGRRVLCIRSRQQSSFLKTLRRAGIQFSRFEEFFEELVVDPGQNSNLNQTIESHSGRCEVLLYAYGSLRTISASVKKRFKPAYEKETTARVVMEFKNGILQRCKRA